MNTDEGETQQSVSVTQPSGSGIQPADSKNKSRKHKRGKSEATNELLEQMITSDQMMISEVDEDGRKTGCPDAPGGETVSTANNADIGPKKDGLLYKHHIILCILHLTMEVLMNLHSIHQDGL